MAEMICRALCDGSIEGEHAPALTIKDTITSPFGLDLFNHILAQLSSNILAEKSQSKGLVLVAFSRSPVYYFDMLKARKIELASSHKWIGILDCYSDPLGWKHKLLESGNKTFPGQEPTTNVNVCRNVKDLDMLFTLITELGKGIMRWMVKKKPASLLLDSVAELLRHASTSAVAGLLSNLRSFDQVSSIFWLLHSDLHESKVTAVLEYLSSMVASLEPLIPLTNGQTGEVKNLYLLEQNSNQGQLNARFKRRNGRVRLLCERFYVEQSTITFSSCSSSDGVVNQVLIPKLQFNLQLSEKERLDRAQVVLPFEHQETDLSNQIYDGRQESKNETIPTTSDNLQSNEDSGKGEIIYFRDSDDERPDSDEDPDDDLDI